ncbi:MAG: Eco57I restriction-modification methylase domain-containing protein, partial [Saprospiraceae bacterium]|nr:Eco57I restriction-modification methylase domain-containing protein [Saprospiraceae bacterium]
LIENCLFGVDINPKSVMICRLRLWIELLKHAYFTAGSKYQSLETLPNIDINIKAGNSLISRFALDSDLKGALKSIKYSINDYRNFVRDYKNSTDKEVKRGLLLIIDEIKNNFRTEIGRNDPKVTKLQKLTSELYHRFTGNFLFEPDAPYGKKKQGGDSLEAKREKAKAELEREIAKLSAEIQEIKSNRIFKNAFEWRFEFPEVLDDDGRFRGFDVVLGNPPYIRQEELGAYKDFFQAHFETYAGTADLYVYFVERGMAVLRPGGQFAYILPNKWMRAGYGDNLRRFVRRHRIEGISDFGDLPVFDEATTYPCILELSRTEALPTFRAAIVGTLDYEGTLADHLRPRAFTVALDGLNDSGWTLSDQTTQRLLDKLRAAGTPLGEYVQGKIYYGIKTGLNEAFVIDAATRERLLAEDPNSAEVIKPFLAGREIKKYRTPNTGQYLVILEKGTTNRYANQLSPEIWLKSTYPAIFSHLKNFESKAQKRYDQGDYWWELRACDYYPAFELPKIFFAEISTEGQFAFDEDGQYCDTTGYIIGSDSKYLIGVLNSRLVTFFFSKISSEIRGGFLRWKRQYVEQIPIPDIPEEAQQPLAAIAVRILAAKRADPQADTSALEAEVDALVYGLYGLTAEEIAVVEGR